jgi:predicted DNA-binding antitoxin AbrB/MazE fold protein
MSGKKTTIQATYEEGRLRPLQPLNLPEGVTIDLTFDPKAFAKRVDASIRRIHRRNRHIPLEEVVKDVDQAIREVRAERRKSRLNSDRS